MSRYIDADALMKRVEYSKKSAGLHLEDLRKIRRWIKTAPSIDIVRCQDCKHWVYNFNGCKRNPCTEPWYATDFCNYGEREGE